MLAERTYAQSSHEDVILRDGSTLRLRPTRPEDADVVVAFLRKLSALSRYLRFHGVAVVETATVEPFVRADWPNRLSLVAERGPDDVVALATFVRLRDPQRAEVAFAVADDFQGHGVGTRLLERLASHAADVGINEFVAEVLPQNTAMLNVFADAGFEEHRRLDGGIIEVRLALASTASYRTLVDQRDHSAVVASLEPFFHPRSVAVVGASARRGTIGGELFRNILAADFVGAAYPVNAKAQPVAGVAGYSTIADISDAIDLAVICLPGEAVIEAARAALEHGIKALCVVSAGFAEVGTEGRARQDELLALVRAFGARMIGPNCLGVAATSVRLNATFAGHSFPPGRAAFSSQSGALGLALLEQAEERGIGVSSFVSVGNKADVSSNDLLEYWQDDPNTDVVLLYLESFGNPAKFARIARRIAQEKPILAMRSGASRAGAQAASSHTAALAGSDAAVDALFRQAGVLRARTLEELIDAAVLLSTQPLPAGNRVAIVTNAGGLGILSADATDAAGLELPELTGETNAALAAILSAEASLANPIDLLGGATATTYEQALPIVVADPNVDAVLALFVVTVVADAGAVAAAIDRVRVTSTKPVVPVVISAGGAPPTAFAYPESAVRALGLAAERAAWLRQPAGVVAELEDVNSVAARAVVDNALRTRGDCWLDGDELRQLFDAYRIPLVVERRAETARDAADAASALGLPAVVKTAVAGAHKTESGGVAVDLRTRADVVAAAERIGGPVVVQPYLHEGVELLAGIVQDPVFGPLVAFGPGGTIAELIGAARFALAPMTDVDVETALTSGKAARLIDGWRGAPSADRFALADLLHRLSRLAVDIPAIAELDLNPIIASPHGCTAVDARVRIREPEALPKVKTW